MVSSFANNSYNRNNNNNNLKDPSKNGAAAAFAAKRRMACRRCRRRQGGGSGSSTTTTGPPPALMLFLRRRFLVWWSLLLVIIFVSTRTMVTAQQASENPLELYGGSVLCMAGREAIVMVCDGRFGRGLGLIAATSASIRPVWTATTSTSTSISSQSSCASSPPPFWIMTATGLPGDIQSLRSNVQAILAQQETTTLQLQLQALPSPRQESILSGALLQGDDGNENAAGVIATTRTMATLPTSPPRSHSVRAAISLISHLLYQQQYLVQPLIAGWQPSFDVEGQAQPVLCTMDPKGATSITHQYAVIGTASVALRGSAARYYQPQLETSQLLQRAVQAFLAGTERDILSGQGVVLYVLHRGSSSTSSTSSMATKLEQYVVKQGTRND